VYHREDEDDYLSPHLSHKSHGASRKSQAGGAKGVPMGSILRQVTAMGDSDRVTLFENAGRASLRRRALQ